MYTVRELRTKLKEALDLAEKGETVEIRRGDTIFLITTITEHDLKGLRDAEEADKVELKGMGNADDMYTADPPIQPLAETQTVHLQRQGTFVPKPPDPELGYPCCQSQTYQCKHWQWDGMRGLLVNTLTGKTREPNTY